MKKITLYGVLLTVLILTGLTMWGPWDTYLWSSGADYFSSSTYSHEMPVWTGEILRYTNGAITEDEAKKDDYEWLERHPWMKEIWEINEYGRLAPKRDQNNEKR